MIRKLHHNAYRCRDSEETRALLRRLPRPAAGRHARDRRDQDRPRDPRAAHLLPARRRLAPGLLRGARTCRSSSSAQHDFDLHIALEVGAEVLQPMLAKGARRASRCAARRTTA